MSNGEPYFVQSTSDEIQSFTRTDWQVIYRLKVSPRCNETKHPDCTMEIKDFRGVAATVHWMYDDVQVGVKNWEWCKCMCHYPLAQKNKWMQKRLPSYKAKA